MEEWSQRPNGSLQNSHNDTFTRVIIAQLANKEAKLKDCAALGSKYKIYTETTDEAITDNSGNH